MGSRPDGEIWAWQLAPLLEVNLDTRVLFFTLTVSVVTGVIFGLAPAIHCSRVNLTESLKESGRASGGRASTRMRGVLIVFETASALVLLIGAGLLIASFARLLNVSPGFNPEGVVIARTSMPAERYPKIELGKAMYRRAIDSIGAHLPESFGRTKTLSANESAGADGVSNG